MIKIKESKKLNALVDQISDAYAATDNCHYDCDIVGELDADCFAITNEDKCRADHFDSHILDGVALVEKSTKTGKPIFCVYCNRQDIIFYFVDELTSIQKKFTAKLAEFKKQIEDNEEKELEELEEKVQKLKAKRK